MFFFFFFSFFAAFSLSHARPGVVGATAAPACEPSPPASSAANTAPSLGTAAPTPYVPTSAASSPVRKRASAKQQQRLSSAAAVTPPAILPSLAPITALVVESGVSPPPSAEEENRRALFATPDLPNPLPGATSTTAQPHPEPVSQWHAAPPNNSVTAANPAPILLLPDLRDAKASSSLGAARTFRTGSDQIVIGAPAAVNQAVPSPAPQPLRTGPLPWLGTITTAGAGAAAPMVGSISSAAGESKASVPPPPPPSNAAPRFSPSSHLPSPPQPRVLPSPKAAARPLNLSAVPPPISSAGAGVGAGARVHSFVPRPFLSPPSNRSEVQPPLPVTVAAGSAAPVSASGSASSGLVSHTHTVAFFLSIFDAAETEIRTELERTGWPRFVRSKLYSELLSSALLHLQLSERRVTAASPFHAALAVPVVSHPN
jgi:hypothetical protein